MREREREREREIAKDLPVPVLNNFKNNFCDSMLV